jgi:preprotein translocase subunit SecF
MINIIGKRKYFYLFSITVVILSIAVISIWGLNMGIDFKGGTQMKIQFSKDMPSNQEIGDALKDANLNSLTIQASENNTAIIRYLGSDESLNQNVLEKIRSIDSEATQLSVDFVGGTISDQLKKTSIWALILGIIGIATYIAIAFKKVSRPIPSWQYGTLAVVALAHDVLITIGVFSVLGKFYGIEVGVPFVAAILTILGYSINDTIVVYDRTRENLLKSGKKESFEEIVNRSINETLARSMNTGMTVIIVLLSIVVLGGESIRDFALALLIGVGFGTYSSIFVASALLVTSYKWSFEKNHKILGFEFGINKKVKKQSR